MATGVDPRGFIGRGGELTRLEAAFEHASEGTAATVVIGGEAGIGKSRLVDEFATRVATRDGTLLSGSCEEFLRSFPLTRGRRDRQRHVLNLSLWASACMTSTLSCCLRMGRS